MADDDDRTVMLDAIGELPGGTRPAPAAHQFKDVGGEDVDEATVMWSPESGNIQSAATIVMSGEEAAAAIAAKSAKQHQAKASGGSNRSVLGGIGALLAFAPMVTMLVFESDVSTALSVSGGLMVFAYAFLGIAFMGQGGLGKLIGITAFIWALMGIAVILVGTQTLKIADPGAMAAIVLSPWMAGLSWVFIGIWGFIRGGGLGISSGIFNLLGGLAAVAGAALMMAASGPSDLKSVALAYLAALACLGVGSILLAIIMFTKLDRHA